ncbi:MAG: patatin-like phospholipase family protein [Rhodoferax sp.]|uniref:patatin-like phospholipase family protein n=1 Tax=Rhodoferax sp. TaxID=50421 RepID=UPI002637554F|nr:patatin-like phospholipase family protein [Rhodoferax sp.]MDD5334820.1 patatin-like phospholipase family protein [Rhodoferax sp.]
MLTQQLLRHGFALLLALLLTACSSVRPWQNLPLPPDVALPTASNMSPDVGLPVKQDSSMLFAITISGGGARAAAFGYGVLDALRQTQVHWNGRDIALLDELDVISGVSGGSIIAAYYAAFGQQTFPAFEKDFLYQNFQDTLIGNVLRPAALYELSSPWFGRTQLLARRLDELFNGKTFGDLAARPGLLISATDLSLGSSFVFSQEQFELICSDLASVPLSFAVASSSAVPIALSPTTLKNYNAVCPRPPNSLNSAAPNDYRVRLLRDSQRSYLDAKTRPYIHLVDGGLADNLGLRTLLEQSLAAGGIRNAARRTSKNAIQKLVIIAVNAERDPSERIDASDKVPGTLQVFDALLFGAGARVTQETLGLLTDTAQVWRSELKHSAAQDIDTFTPDAQIYVVNVNLRDAPELLQRTALLQIPTALSIVRADVHLLVEAGRHILLESHEFKALLKSFNGDLSAPTGWSQTEE